MRKKPSKESFKDGWSKMDKIDLKENNKKIKRSFKDLLLGMKSKISLSLVVIFWLSITLVAWTRPADSISEHERRPLEQLPALEVKEILSGQYMKDFEEYAKDQFPSRFGFRSIKSLLRYYVFLQSDNNDIFIHDKYASKLEFPMSESSINLAGKKFSEIYEKYLKDTNTKNYLSIIPDKNFYLAKPNGYPSMDYDLLFELIRRETGFAQFIDIRETLKLEDFYKTDTHWKQEALLPTVKKILKEMNMLDYFAFDYEKKMAEIDFYGVYYGQSALPLKSEKIYYLTNIHTQDSQVFNLENNSYTSVYDMDRLQGNDPYDIFLSGASAFLVVENPHATSDKELVIFRDSFGSSISPLFLEGYSKVTLVDIRYIASDLIGRFIDFENQDVLFLYSALILNRSATFK